MVVKILLIDAFGETPCYCPLFFLRFKSGRFGRLTEVLVDVDEGDDLEVEVDRVDVPTAESPGILTL